MFKVEHALCHKCALASCKFVPSYPAESGRAKITLVGEAPGATEAAQGKPFVGQAGRLLNVVMEKAGLDRADCFITNVVLCRPPNNKTPNLSDIDACLPRLKEEIRQTGSKVIVLMGNTAVKALLNRKGGITNLRGQVYYSGEFNAFILPTYHPAAVLRQPSLFNDFASDLRKIGEVLEWDVQSFEDLRKPPKRAVITDPKLVRAMVNYFIKNAKTIACDIETSGFDWFKDDVLCIGFAVAESDAKPDPIRYIIPEKALKHPIVVAALRELFAFRGIRFVWHNGKFDTKFLDKLLGIQVPVDHDTMLLHYTVNEERGTHDLKQLARNYCYADDYEADIKKFLPKKTVSFRAIPEENLHTYLSHDVHYTEKLFHILRREVYSDEPLKRLYETLLIPGSNVLKRMEIRGVHFDNDLRYELENRYTRELAELTSRLQEFAHLQGVRGPKGTVFNPRSWQQVAAVLYDRLKLRSPNRKEPRGTSEEILTYFAKKQGVEFARLVLEHRKLSKLLSTYVIALADKVGPDGRIHCDYLLHGTVTGRLASRDPNLQNIPRESAIRDLFVAKPGWVLLQRDYSQAELRVLAWLSGDEWLKNVFRTGRDIHSEVGSEIFNKPASEITKDERVQAKAVVFGLNYGRQASSLAKQLEISQAEAQRYIDAFFRPMPGVKRYVEEVQAKARRGEILETPFGRRRRFGLITNDNLWDVQRQAINFPIQSIASDITLHSLIRLDKELDPSIAYPVLTIHDSLVFEVKEEHLEEVAKITKEIMEDIPLNMDIPYTTEAEIGTRWGSVKKVAGID